MKTRIRVVFIGRVQGVCFRYHTSEAARSLPITGLVRNLRDGTVEAEIQGKPEGIETALSAMHEPPIGRVQKIQNSWASAREDETDFRIRY